MDKTITNAMRYGKQIGKKDEFEVHWIPLYQEYWVFKGLTYLIKGFRYRDVKAYLD